MTDLYHNLSLSTDNAEIRLVEMDSQNLHLRAYAFQYAPPYVTLSYAWNENTDHLVNTPKTVGIFVNDVAILITVQPNLWLFLERAKQHLPRGTHVWIDAICINEADVPERNHQVGLMKRIYSDAVLTIVWLGESAGGTHDLSYLQMPHLTEGDPNVWFPPWDIDTEKPLETEYDSWIAKYGLCYHPTDPRTTGAEKQHNLWITLDTMCRRRYWTRLWVVQEFTLSQKICIWLGSNLLQLGEFASGVYKVTSLEVSDQRRQWRDAFANAKSAVPVLGPALDLCLARCDPAYGTDSPPSFEKTFNLFSSQRYCTNQYDNVYALLSLCREPITPDYAKPRGHLFWEILRLPANSDCVRLGRRLYKQMQLRDESAVPDVSMSRFNCIYDEWAIEATTSHFGFLEKGLETHSFFRIISNQMQSEPLFMVTKCALPLTRIRIRHVVDTVILLLYTSDSVTDDRRGEDETDFIGVGVLVSLQRYQPFDSPQYSSRLTNDSKTLNLLLEDCDRAFKASKPRVQPADHLGDFEKHHLSLSLDHCALGFLIFCENYAAALTYAESRSRVLGLPDLADDGSDSR